MGIVQAGFLEKTPKLGLKGRNEAGNTAKRREGGWEGVRKGGRERERKKEREGGREEGKKKL